MNKVILIGRAGADADVKFFPDGGALCNVSVATSRNWKDKTSGEKVSETEWHRVVFSGRLAEIAGEFVKKGRELSVEGRLKTRKWADKEGVERYTTEVIADRMELLGGKSEYSGDAEGSQNSAAPSGYRPQVRQMGQGPSESSLNQPSSARQSGIPRRGSPSLPPVGGLALDRSSNQSVPSSANNAFAPGGHMDDDIPFAQVDYRLV